MTQNVHYHIGKTTTYCIIIEIAGRTVILSLMTAMLGVMGISSDVFPKLIGMIATKR